jgi:hypothetical protein
VFLLLICQGPYTFRQVDTTLFKQDMSCIAAKGLMIFSPHLMSDTNRTPHVSFPFTSSLHL